MSKRLITLILVVLLFGPIARVWAEDIFWDDGDPCDHLWSSPNNWNPDGVPELIDANTELGDCAHVQSGFGLGNSPVVDESVILADPNTGSRSLTIIVGAWNPVPEDEAYLTMTRGELLIAWEVILGLTRPSKGPDLGTLNMTGGYIHTLDTVFVGAYGVGTLNMTDPCGIGGGTIDIDATLHIPGEIDWLKGIGSGHVNLDAGTINCGDISMGLGLGGTMDINEGVLNVQGNAMVKVIGYVENGWITGRGSGDPRNVSVVYDDVNDVTVVMYDPTPDLTLAWKPRPLPGSTDVSWQPTLSWEAGIYADTHSVYFGSSMSDVNASATPVSVNQPGTTYDPAGYLKFGTTYYWRIDEVNDACEPYVWPGAPWSFTVGDSVLVDNFDEYLDYGALTAVWDDYYVNDSGAEIDLETDANLARAGKSMSFAYDNDHKYKGNYMGSWADADTVDLDVGSDWTAGEVKALALYFYGQSGNSTGANDKLQLVLEDTSSNIGVVAYPDTNALAEESWHEWNIELADFDACGVSLANLSRIHIGTDDWYVPASGGIGTLYFDEIRVHPRRCVTEYGPDGDTTGDCAVDYGDVNDVATDWLLDDYNIVATSPASGPVGWWMLDEGSGTTANDSAGSNHGTWGGTIAEPRWFDDPCRGYVMDFDGVSYFDIPSAAFADVNDELTITFWEYGTMTPSEEAAHVMFHAHDACSPYDLTVKCELWHPAATGCDLFFDAGTGGEASADSVSGRASAAEYTGQWNHYAFTKNVSSGEMRIYLNGVLFADEDTDTLDAPVKGSEISSFKIGSDADADRKYDGYLSDVRLYKYALSYGEVRHVAGEMDDLLIPLPRPEVDVYADGEIDFYDYAVVADDWLTEILWPSL